MANGNYFTDDENAHNLLRIGERLQGGKYRVDRYLASGGFGNTYLVTNTLLDIPLVIKEFYIKGVTSRTQDGRTVTVSLTENRPMWDKMLEKFKREARHMFKINHANIVRVHDFFEENATAYYVMDLVAGESLRERMERTGRPIGEAELTGGILPQVLAALERIHSENIWHLDIKPANLMQERGGTVKLIDFGASKQSSPGEGMTTTSLAYTPGYASPEQVSQHATAIGPWSDLYSLGATLYNLLTRRTPPSQVDIDDDGIAAFDFTSVQVSDRMRHLITQLMLTPRRQRPQCVADVRRLLNGPMATVAPQPAAQRQPQMQQRSVAAPTPVQRPISRQPESRQPAAVVNPAVEEMTQTIDSRQPKPKQPQRAPKAAVVGAVTAEKPKSKRPLIIAIAAVVAVLLAAAITYTVIDSNSAESASHASTSSSGSVESASINPDDIRPDDASYTAEPQTAAPANQKVENKVATQPVKQTAAPKPQRPQVGNSTHGVANNEDAARHRVRQMQQNVQQGTPAKPNNNNNANVRNRESGYGNIRNL